MNRNIEIYYPKKIVFGPDVLQQMLADFPSRGYDRLLIIMDPFVGSTLSPVVQELAYGNFDVKIIYGKGGEPSFSDLDEILTESSAFDPNGVLGIGGGSVLDLAKLTAALLNQNKPAREFVGKGLIRNRDINLICAPTTSGAGSEASPNALLIEEKDNSKKGIISPYLVPDEVYIDPKLMVSLPPAVTAYTGLDALTHCIEAFTNRFAHPLIDHVALEGIKLIGKSLKVAVKQGTDLEARSNVAIGSLYGGMCLGPVNTAAVHALAYPLGTKFKIPHGLSNALLLPYVMEYNLDFAEEKYASIALAMGAEKGSSCRETALNGIQSIRELIRDCHIPSRLSDLEIPVEAIEGMAKDAMDIQRLLKNNIKDVRFEDAVAIYKQAY